MRLALWFGLAALVYYLWRVEFSAEARRQRRLDAEIDRLLAGMRTRAKSQGRVKT